jgi:hypothetical protein
MIGALKCHIRPDSGLLGVVLDKFAEDYDSTISHHFFYIAVKRLNRK